MDNFNSDPKPGRLILPLVLIGMIATTYTFINRVATQNDLEIIDENIFNYIDPLNIPNISGRILYFKLKIYTN